MKRIIKLLLYLFLAQTVKAQIVNIPDANFKAKLIQQGVDTNSDGEIQQNEAESIQNLGIGPSNITDLTGIQSFTNLITLDCSENQITTLDLSGLTSLQAVGCWNNQITSLNVTGCENLIGLYCNNNQITGSLNLSNSQFLYEVNFSDNLITSLNVSNCPLLSNCLLTNNPALVQINASNCPNLTGSFADNFPNLVSLNIENCTSFQDLSISSPQLQTLNVSGCTGLFTVQSLVSTQLTSIDFSGLYNLIGVSMPEHALLTTANFSGCLNLEDIYLYDCGLTQIDVSNCPKLISLGLYNNQLTVLDVSTNSNLQNIDCQNNQLQTIFAKNGTNETIGFSNNPNLQFVCVDESQVNAVQANLITAGLTSTVCNSYCSFTPGGDYNTIQGNVKLDSDANGCDTLDTPLNYVRINVNNGTSTSAVFTNLMGHYTRYELAGNFTLTPVLENSSAFAVTPSQASVNFPDTNNNQFVQDFCVSVLPPLLDLEVVIMPIGPARPGFDATYKVVYKNKGNATMDGNVSFLYDELVLDFVNASLVPSNQSTGLLSWNFTNLAPLETRFINITLNVNSPVETPAVNIGDQLDFEAIINPVVNDETPADNAFGYKQTVVGSYDPNTIACLEGDTVPDTYIGQYLHYGVNFENTGNYPAENVVVRIEIDPTKFDVETLQLLNTSHEVNATLSGNVIEFIFQNIQLDSGGHGNILFKIKTLPNLNNGDMVSKRADIFFDYNAPVDTGMATTTFETLSTSVLELDNSISVYPNPTNSILNVNSNFNIKSIALYDVQGRLLQTQLTEASATTLDISNQARGVYFIKITSEAGSKIEKIVKE